MRSERRLHPAAAVAGALESLRDALLPVVVGFFVSGGGSSRAVVFAVLGVAGAALAGYARWRRTAYWVSDDALHLRSGVFNPDERVVPLARVTGFDEVRGPVQRLFGVEALHVQTAGGGAQGEIVLSAVSPDAAAALRALVRDAPATAEAEPDARWRLSFGMLVVAAVTGPQLGVVLPAVGGAAAIGFQALGDDEDGQSLLRQIPDAAGGWQALAAIVAAGTLLLALAGAIVAFGGFVAERRGARLRVRRGYVQRRASSLDVARVHAVRVVEGALRRPFGLCSIRLEVAGYAEEPAVGQTLVPLCPRADAAAILARLVPELPLPAGPPGRPPLRALSRFVWPPLLTGAVVAVPLAVVVGPVAAVAPVLLSVTYGVARHRAAGWWLQDGVVAARSLPLLARTTTVALPHRLQDTVLADTLTGRRAGLASVSFTVASKHAAGVRNLPVADARRLFGHLRAAASAHPRDPTTALPRRTA